MASSNSNRYEGGSAIFMVSFTRDTETPRSRCSKTFQRLRFGVAVDARQLFRGMLARRPPANEHGEIGCSALLFVVAWVLGEVVALGVAEALGAAAFCFFECTLGPGVPGTTAQVEEQFAVEGEDAGDRTS